MARKTAAQRLRAELNLALDFNRNAAQQLVSLRAERDRYLDAASECNTLRRSLEATSIKVARLEGYIDRVRENDTNQRQLHLAQGIIEREDSAE